MMAQTACWQQTTRMGKTADSSQRPEPSIVIVGRGDGGLLAEAIVLGNEDKRTLGFLPHQAYEQACVNGTLIAAVENGHVLAYALYSLPRQVVRLTHLCVSSEARGRGLARLLIETISQRHADRFGITLKCRNDFAASAMWPRLGFKRQGEIPGRSRKRLPLTIWWRDHGHPALFSAAESLGLLRVMLDLNVFIDLESSYERPEYLESGPLAGDWLADQVDLVISDELLVEIGRHPDQAEKERQLRAAGRYLTVRADDRALDAAASRITDLVLKADGADLSVSTNDVSDVRHLATAWLSGITVIATRDEKFIDWSVRIAETTGVRVMRPSDVVLQLDELSRAQEYRPAQLEDTQYALTQVRPRPEAELLQFLHDNKGERKSDYLAMIRQLLAEGPRWNRRILRDPHGEAIAFFVTGIDDAQFSVPVLRVKAQRHEETVTRQMLFHIRKQACALGKSIMRITDPVLADSMVRAVREDGFVYHKAGWVGFAIQACGNAPAVDDQLTRAAALAGLQVPALRPGLSAPIAADLERTLWPAKITDSELPTFIVPIRPQWSAELFGVPQILMPRPNMLGISREHVYYRSPRPRVVEAPARLMWYASGAGKDHGVGTVIACSRLEEVISAKPASLHQRFRHLGVWQQDQIAGVARDGTALALRFADTELLPHRVSHRRLEQLAASQNCRPPSLQSAVKISSQLFTAIYQEGLSRHERA
jgi:ribosomal protein S18 acetylase RimI-like enzyme/predicted nucleic acid-binding protein